MEKTIVFLAGAMLGISLVLSAGFYILKTRKGATYAQASAEGQPIASLSAEPQQQPEVDHSASELDHADMLFGFDLDQQPGTTEKTPEMAWHCLPGNVLELGTTGFQICLVPDPSRPQHPYRLLSPEGVGLLYGAEGSLDLVKRCALKMAADRLSFNEIDKKN